MLESISIWIKFRDKSLSWQLDGVLCGCYKDGKPFFSICFRKVVYSIGRRCKAIQPVDSYYA